MGHIASKLGVREQGALPSQPDMDVKERCKAITLNSKGEQSATESLKLKDEILPLKKRKTYRLVAESLKIVEDKPKEDLKSKAPVKPYTPPIPFPQRLKNLKLEKQYEKFLKMFRELHDSIPFTDDVAQMPLYVKFMKEVLSNRKKLEEVETINLNEQCSAVIQHNISPKLKDPGSFSLPCIIGKVGIKRALCDLGASVSLMPNSLYKRLGLGKLKKSRISLQLADRTIKYPLGMLKDVLVKVDKFVIPCDFVVLEMDEDENIPIILGYIGIKIDVKHGKHILNVDEEKVEFDLNQAKKGPFVEERLYLVDSSEECLKERKSYHHDVDATSREKHKPVLECKLDKGEVIQVDVVLGPLAMVSRYPP